MKRIVVLIDGTWNKEGAGADTNVAKLDGATRAAGQAFIKATAADGFAQHVHYHDGVGVEGNLLNKLLGGAIGLGLKKIIQEVYETIVADFVAGAGTYLLGLSRGAWAARALAGLLGASGIQRVKNPDGFEVAWQHYRVAPSARTQPHSGSAGDRQAVENYNSLAQQQAFHDTRTIKCVGVWDTVGSYGIPAGIGLAPLARYYMLLTFGLPRH